MGTWGYRSQWHPSSTDIVASLVRCSDPGLVVPSKAGTWRLYCGPSAVSEGLGQGLGCGGTSRSRLCPGLAGWNAGVSRYAPRPRALLQCRRLLQHPLGTCPGAACTGPQPVQGTGAPQGLYWEACLSPQHVRDSPGWRGLQGWAWCWCQCSASSTWVVPQVISTSSHCGVLLKLLLDSWADGA